MPMLVARFAKALFIAPALTLLLAAGAARAASVAPEQVPFADRVVTVAGATYKYQVFVPKHLDKKKKPPVILFLHGAGERGSDGQAETKNGVRLLIARDVDNFPAVVVCPQAPTDMRWTQTAMQDIAIAALDQEITEFHGDPRRVYLTGLSMGGYGTWEIARKHPERWAAIAPVCGGVIYPSWMNAPADETTASEKDPYGAVAKAISGIPIWDFHGDADPTVPVSESRQLVAALLGHGADIRYTEYPGVAHNSWDNAYAEPTLLPWLLSHKLPK